MGEVTTNSGFQSCEEALTAEMMISEERVDQTSSHPCKGFIKNLEYFDDCNRAVSDIFGVLAILPGFQWIARSLLIPSQKGSYATHVKRV